jgi:hypothetical protein
VRAFKHLIVCIENKKKREELTTKNKIDIYQKKRDKKNTTVENKKNEKPYTWMLFFLLFLPS